MLAGFECISGLTLDQLLQSKYCLMSFYNLTNNKKIMQVLNNKNQNDAFLLDSGAFTLFLGLGAAILINNFIKNLTIKQIVTAISVSLATILVAIELHIVSNLPILPTFATVALGQLISQILGIFITRILNKRINLADF